MSDVSELLKARHSSRVPFDAARRVPAPDLERILEAARWAPTPHNMQNFEIIVIDDPVLLDRIGEITSRVSLEFLRENREQVSFSEEELRRRGVGILAKGFPPAWLDRSIWENPSDDDELTRTLRDSILQSPVLLVVLYDSERRAPASAGDTLGLIGLGCVLENMWLTAESLGVATQVLASLAGADVEPVLAELLGVPSHLRVAFGCRLGYPVTTDDALHVRRDVSAFTHRNAYGAEQGTMSNSVR